MQNGMDDRRFHPITGEPLFFVKGCENVRLCSYPYCQCDVKHDKNDKPLKEPQMKAVLHVRLMAWISIVIFCSLFWGTFLYELMRNWP